MVSAEISSGTGVTGPSGVVITCCTRPSIQSRPCSSRWPTSPVRCQTRSVPPALTRGLALCWVCQRRSYPSDIHGACTNTSPVASTVTSQPSTGTPTHTPRPGPINSSSASATSATGSTSVIPYGVCSAAPGHRPRILRSVSIGTGAPADITSRIAPSAGRDPVAVRTTFASAAGEANTIVAPIRAHASSSALAVSVAGAVTSMSARPVTMPRAGPNTAKGANAATKRSAGVMPYIRRSASRCAHS
ncbi:unannotated protein [freshwater metagenome]|uniref:Unannotated protein n=1 Tax=freshwater metagenome TaxID=449393 RepID=A0A6J7E8R9_9ZZZZ